MTVASARATPSLVFVLGPWGSGKSSLGRGMAALGFDHVEVDRWLEGDGIALAGLNPEWARFAATGWFGPLHDKLRARARGRRGLVITFPAIMLPQPQHYRALRRAGVHVAICYGTAAECLDGWMARERAHGRPADPEHWIAHNAAPYVRFSAPEHAAYRLASFRDGAFVGADALAAIAVARIEGASRSALAKVVPSAA